MLISFLRDANNVSELFKNLCLSSNIHVCQAMFFDVAKDEAVHTMFGRLVRVLKEFEGVCLIKQALPHHSACSASDLQAHQLLFQKRQSHQQGPEKRNKFLIINF